MIHLVDFMLHDWKDRAVIDPARVGLFGFSLGAYTGLVLVGGNADLRRMTIVCKEDDRTENCERARSGDVPPSPPHDPRIKVAVLADIASTWAFDRAALSGIQIPLQIWRSELGGYGVVAKFTALITSQLPGSPEVHVVPAGHYAFLTPCSAGSQPPSRASAPTIRWISTGLAFTASSTPASRGFSASISSARAKRGSATLPCRPIIAA